MQVNRAIFEMLGYRGISANRASAELGRSREYVRNAAVSKRGPLLSTVAAIADVCGCEIVVRDRATGEELGTIDPPRD